MTTMSTETDLTEAGCCPNCGHDEPTMARATLEIHGTDVTWPTCDECGWVGEP